MPLQGVPIETFGGLDLVHDPGEVAATGAIDLADVDFDQLGRVKSRQGYVKYTTVPGTDRADSLHTFGQPTGADIVLAGAALSVVAYLGGNVLHSTTSAASPHFFTGYGTATEPRVYIANGVDVLRYYTTSGFTTPTTTGITSLTTKFLCTQQPDNRLVAAWFPDARSRVRFSEPGDPHNFQDDNFVDLSPGDGEEITGAVTWREYTFVFKETKFYVFFGNDTDTSGEPIFNFRGVYGAGVRIGDSAVAGADGAYFVDRTGVYKTSGGNAALISRPVEPLFAPVSNKSPDAVSGIAGRPVLHWADDRLYLAFSSGTVANDQVLVYHCTDQWWSLWNVPASTLTTARVSATDPLQESLLFGYATGSNDLGQFTDAATDDGVAIDAWWQSGFMDYGDSDAKVLREVLVDGNGHVNIAVATNYGPVPAGVNVALPTATTGRKHARYAYRGHNFSVRIASSDGSAWRINRLVNAVGSKRELGLEAPA